MIKSTRDCENLLNRYKEGFVCKCGNKKPIKQTGLVKVCSKCKKKYSVTNGTIFHNIRFGLLKAFRISIKEYNNSFTSTSTEVAKEFDITQKTSWIFLNRIRNRKDEIIDFMEFINNQKKSKNKSDKPKKEHLDKLNAYLKKDELINKLNSLF